MSNKEMRELINLVESGSMSGRDNDDPFDMEVYNLLSKAWFDHENMAKKATGKEHVYHVLKANHYRKLFKEHRDHSEGSNHCVDFE